MSNNRLVPCVWVWLLLVLCCVGHGCTGCYWCCSVAALKDVPKSKHASSRSVPLSGLCACMLMHRGMIFVLFLLGEGSNFCSSRSSSNRDSEDDSESAVGEEVTPGFYAVDLYDMWAPALRRPCSVVVSWQAWCSLCRCEHLPFLDCPLPSPTPLQREVAPKHAHVGLEPRAVHLGVGFPPPGCTS